MGRGVDVAGPPGRRDTAGPAGTGQGGRPDIAGQAAGVVVAGGRSSRMGTAKAALAWHGSTLLHRTASVLRRSVGGPVVVVRAAGQPLPALPEGVAVIEDPEPGRGPLQGIAAGLAAVAAAPAAFVCATDLPFLHPAFVHAVLAALGDADVALPVARGFRQPLAAAYRTGLAGVAAALLDAGERRPGALFAACSVACLDEDALRADPGLAHLDPDLDSLVGVNTPEEYAAAAARTAPSVAVERVGPAGRRCTVRAATLAEAAAAAGVTLTPDTATTLGGDRVAPEPGLPLVAGDVVGFGPRPRADGPR